MNFLITAPQEAFFIVATLYLFNPENDLALAQGSKNYTAPPLARAIAYDLATLPLWYADKNDTVWLPTPHFASPLQPILDALAISCHTATATCLPTDIWRCRPWGWSPEVAHRLVRHGIPTALLPDDKKISVLRDYGHRLHTRDILLHLQACGCSTPHTLPQLLTDEKSVQDFLLQHPRALLKAPWSGSGKGLCWVLQGYDLATVRRVQGILHKQGGVIGEPYYPKVQDFAMEFRADGTMVTFAGYSSFTTDDRGAYKGNLLASDSKIEALLSQYIPIAKLQAVRDALIGYFTTHISPIYQGYFGVDMMIYTTCDGYALHPCIEMNLRMNMGMVSRIFYDRYVAKETSGLYRVEYFADSSMLMHDHRLRAKKSPLQITNGKITSGYLALNPIYPDTRYRASVEIIQNDIRGSRQNKR